MQPRPLADSVSATESKHLIVKLFLSYNPRPQRPFRRFENSLFRPILAIRKLACIPFAHSLQAHWVVRLSLAIISLQ